MIDYLNDNGAAFTFLATVVLACITAVYVYFTWRLARSQQEATRQASEPVLVPEVVNDGKDITLVVTNVSGALATGLMVYPRSRDNGLVVKGAMVRAALQPGQEARFTLVTFRQASDQQLATLPDDWAEDLRPDKPLSDDPNGGFEVLYSDAHDRTLIRTSIDVMQYRQPLTDEAQDDWWLMTPILRERHTREALMRKVGRRDKEIREINENSPCSDLWVGAYGVMMGC